MINFGSDNVVGAHPAILDALTAGNEGAVGSYGADPVTERVEARLSEIFERSCKVFPVVTGTAANALALSALAPPYGAIYCHRQAHIQVDEAGAPELMTAGAKLIPLEGADAKVTPVALKAAIFGVGDEHSLQPSALSISQASELGTVYRLDELAALGEVCREANLKFHIDGARFANALVSLGATPAEITWKAGVDVLSFGATKNGCLAAEAVIFFDPALVGDFVFRRKRAGHLISKMRFLSLQLEAYLAGDLWLSNARHANAMARRMAEGLAALPGVTLPNPVEANGIYPRMPDALVTALNAEGFLFGYWGYPWDRPSSGNARLLTSYRTTEAEVDALLTAAKRLV